MLEIAVDDRDEIGAGGEPTLDDSACQTDAIDAPETAQARVAGGDGVGDVRGAVGRIVVDDDHFPRQALERRRQTLEQHAHVRRFAIGRHDHGEGIGADSPRVGIHFAPVVTADARRREAPACG